MREEISFCQPALQLTSGLESIITFYNVVVVLYTHTHNLELFMDVNYVCRGGV